MNLFSSEFFWIKGPITVEVQVQIIGQDTERVELYLTYTFQMIAPMPTVKSKEDIGLVFFSS